MFDGAQTTLGVNVSTVAYTAVRPLPDPIYKCRGLNMIAAEGLHLVISINARPPLGEKQVVE